MVRDSRGVNSSGILGSGDPSTALTKIGMVRKLNKGRCKIEFVAFFT